MNQKTNKTLLAALAAIKAKAQPNQMIERMKIATMTALFGPLVLLFFPNLTAAPNLSLSLGEVADENTKIKRLFSVLQKHAQKENFEMEFLLSVIKTESDFNPKATSRVGALGLMQLMPATAMEHYAKSGFNPGSKRLRQGLIHQPELNIALGVEYLSHLRGYFEKVKDAHLRKKLMLAAYNAGIKRVRRAFGCRNMACVNYKANRYSQKRINRALHRLPRETRRYFGRIKNWQEHYQASGLTTI